MREFRAFVYQPPTLTFEHDLRIDLGGRVVELRFLGRGNTAGDVVAWLPQERIVVAGDLVDHPVPYAFGGYPTEWSRTLRRLAALDAAILVPGHGAVLRDRRYLQRVIALLDDVQRQVNALIDRRGSAASVEEAVRSIDLSAERLEMAGNDADSQAFFDASMASLIRLVFAEVKAR
jgi:glyoxylase-like metal-dependent hydrolase (beta-lactamase superfamily II)